MNRIALGFTLCLALSACDMTIPSWMGGPPPEIERLPGERITVLPVDQALQPDPSLKDFPVAVPAPYENAEWPQHNGYITAATGNLAAKGAFEDESSARAGKGESFDHALVPRPVVGGGKVYAMDAEGNISAHDMNDITTIFWQSEGVSEEDEDDVLGGGLAFDQGRVYATSGRGAVAALDAASGKVLWKKSVRSPFRSAPRISGGRLFALTIDSQIYAFDAASGEIIWTQRGIDETTGLMNSVSPAVTGEMVIVPYASGELYALSTIDGRELWNASLAMSRRTEASGIFAGIGGDPVIDGNVVFGVSAGGFLAVFGIPTGQRMWERPIASVNTPWVAGDYMFLLTANNTLVAFVKYDGRISWATRLPSYGDEERKLNPIAWKGPVMAGGRLAVVSSHGELVLIAAENGKVISTLSIPDGIHTAPVIAGGKMYLAGKNATLYSLQ